MQPVLLPVRRFLVAIVFGTVFGLFASASSVAGENPVYTSLFSNNAAGGYDVTSYFSAGGPAKGSIDFATEYKGATWRFASRENLGKFRSDPQKYAPQYGGYCAWAAAQGDLQKGDPEHWDIYRGKLYLNFDDQTQQAWRSDREGFVSRADRQWPSILEKK